MKSPKRNVRKLPVSDKGVKYVLIPLFINAVTLIIYYCVFKRLNYGSIGLSLGTTAFSQIATCLISSSLYSLFFKPEMMIIEDVGGNSQVRFFMDLIIDLKLIRRMKKKVVALAVIVGILFIATVLLSFKGHWVLSIIAGLFACVLVWNLIFFRNKRR